MAYAAVEDLAAALRITATPANEPLLTACLDAATDEIDAYLDRTTEDVLPDPAPASVARCNVNRAVEWYKAADAASGAVGFDQVGVLEAPPGDGFARHGLTIRSFKRRWGLA